MAAFLDSERIVLRTINKDDLPELARLMADREIGMLSGEVHPITEKSLEGFYGKCQDTGDRVWFLIEDKATRKVIGETGFLRVFMPWRTSDYSLMIWDRAFWGRGYGKEAAGMMLEYGFDFLNLHRVAIGVVGLNGRAIRFWKSVGFVEEGIQKDGFYSQGKYSDFIMMRLLENEWRSGAGR